MAYVTAQQVADSLLQGQGTGTSLTGTEVLDLEAIIDAVTGWIDEWCGWSFTDDGASTRTFEATDPYRLELPRFCPLQTVTAVSVDRVNDGLFSTAWATTDVELGPLEAPYRGHPYTHIQAVGRWASGWECWEGPFGTDSYSTRANAKPWPVNGRGSVRITGTWGWAAVPSVVITASIMQASRLWHRRHTPDGIAGLTPDGGAVTVPRIDPDVASLLSTVRKPKPAAITSVRVAVG